MVFRNLFPTLSPLQKLLFFLFLLVAGFVFSTLLSIIILVPLYGSQTLTLFASLNDLTNPSVVVAMKVIQITGQIVMFILPAFIMSILCSPSGYDYFGLKRKNPFMHYFLIILLIFIALPFISWITDLNSHLRLPYYMAGIEHWMKSSEDNATNIVNAFLKSPAIGVFLVNIFMMAILPAAGEELVFRGVVQKHLIEWFKSGHLGVIITSLIFAAIHLQFYGFLPRLLLGLTFGYIYLWTGNLWLTILAHFIFNMITVVTEFMSQRSYIQIDADNFGKSDSPLVIITAFVLAAGILYYINRHYRETENISRL